MLQIVTTGTDRKIAYWDAYDGSAVRLVDASEDSAMCDVHVDCEGLALVSGSVDSRVQVRSTDCSLADVAYRVPGVSLLF